MLHILLLILKIIGIILAVMIGILLLALICVLFVPIRYRIKADGKLGEEEPFHAQVKVTWLLHIVNVVLSYTRSVDLKVRIFCFTIFDSSRRKKEIKNETKKEMLEEKQVVKAETADKVNADNENENEKIEDEIKEDTKEISGKENSENRLYLGKEENGKLRKIFFNIVRFFNRFFEILKNIEYTIKKICDRIEKIIGNIRYYTDLIQSKIFRSAFAVSKKQLFRILRALRPERCRVDLLAGTGDPASTGQILAVYGMMYPFIGNSVSIRADFENKVAEGDLYIKGKLTVIIFLIAAFRLYMDKNIRKLLKLLKREDV